MALKYFSVYKEPWDMILFLEFLMFYGLWDYLWTFFLVKTKIRGSYGERKEQIWRSQYCSVETNLDKKGSSPNFASKPLCHNFEKWPNIMK